MKRLAVVASFVFFSCSASAECVFSERPQEEKPYKLNLSDSECKLVRYSGGSVVTIFLNYPTMEVVGERALDSSLVVLNLVYISKSTFNQDALFEGKRPLSLKDGIEEYQVGSRIIRRFVGSDGGVTIVPDRPYTRRASHLFNYEIDVDYQYALEHEDIKAMDDFVVRFLRKITRN